MESHIPISLTSTVGKTMERLVTNRPLYFAECRHGHSTEDQLLRLSQSISDVFQQSPMQRAVVAHFDYSRAYNKVRRDALLMKMSQKGIPSGMVRWIQAWLSDRLTWVTFDGVRSRTENMKQGVPQGSVLSPLPFLFYIDDLASAVGAPPVSLFADDVAAWMQDTDLEQATYKLQKGLDSVTRWRKYWKMKLSAKNQRSFFTINMHEARWRPSLYLSRQQIKYNQNPKLLGITYDRQLTFGLHASIVGSKMKQQAGALRCQASEDWGY